MRSIPLSFNSAALTTYPGRCAAEQVGVKAPGRANNTTFLPAKISSVLTSETLSPVFCCKVNDGIFSPT